MIIGCELLGQHRKIFLDSRWSYNPFDPFAVMVKFEGQPAVWAFSLELLMDAFTTPEEGLLHGSGDLLLEVGGDFTIIHLSNGGEAASVQFSTADIQSFLDRISIPSSDEVIASKLDEFLETL